jgi:hypothetical protein
MRKNKRKDPLNIEDLTGDLIAKRLYYYIIVVAFLGATNAMERTGT